MVFVCVLDAAKVFSGGISSARFHFTTGYLSDIIER